MGIWESLANSSEVKLLLFLRDQEEVRYSKLGKLFKSRATLDWALRHLVSDGLIKRKVVEERPIQSFYALTPKGAEAAKLVRDLIRILQIGFGER